MPATYGIGLYAPAGFAQDPAALTRAVARLEAMGHSVVVDPTCHARWQRFAAPDDDRLAAVLRMAADPRVELAITLRGGYGWTRLLPRLDFHALAGSGKRWLGYSDFTAFQLAALQGAGMKTYAGPSATGDFGAESPSTFMLDHCFGLLGSDHYEVTCDLDGLDEFCASARRIFRASPTASCSWRTWASTRIASSACCTSCITPAYCRGNARSCSDSSPSSS
jgi:muramoyltetrapeptide carboxypeptidase LdcA involved in peptidoglycan recycling